MSSNREPILQRDPALTMRNRVTINPARNFGTPGLESDARRIGLCHSLLDPRIPLRATEPAFGHLPPWAQPAWIRRFPR